MQVYSDCFCRLTTKILTRSEFTMAEIEHYVDPKSKDHPRFVDIKDQKLRLLAKDVQSAGKSDLAEISIGEAVEKGIVDNETLGYFMVRIYLFLIKIGIDPSRLRFRQHMANEMAHYASDCWDAEIHTSYGWIECVGCADRSAYDLTVHSTKTGTKLLVRENLDKPVTQDVTEAVINKKAFGPHFKKEARFVEEGIKNLSLQCLQDAERDLKEKQSYDVTGSNGQVYAVTPNLVTVETKAVTTSTREFTPNVIEPSFGIGRILYSLLEHAYWAREEDVARAVLSLPPSVAPIKVLIVPISSQEAFKPILRDVSLKLRRAGLASRVDDSGASIGKRYARNDELGTPFGISIDFATLKNGTITLRERDTTVQLIGKIDEVIGVVIKLCEGELTWDEACKTLPLYDGVQDA